MSEAWKLKTLRSGLEEVGTIPLWGTVPPFPWHDFSKQLSGLFEHIQWDVSHRKSEWLSEDELQKGMGANPYMQTITLSPLPGYFIWMMPQADKRQLIHAILGTKGKEASFAEESLEEGFIQFLHLHFLDLFNQFHPFGPLSASLLEPLPLPEEGGLAIDLVIRCNEKALSGRLVCSQETLAAFRTHFAMEHPPLVIEGSLAAVSVSLSLEVGSSALTERQWAKVQVGDLVLLDRCTFDVRHRKGTGRLVLGNTPLFDLRIKEGEIKVLEYAITQEENLMMEEPPTEDEFSNEDDSYDEKLPLEEELSAEAPSMEDEEPEEEPLWEPSQGEGHETPLHLPPEIPLPLVVEIARIQMPLGKLSQLQPGNVLDLALAPTFLVHLTSNGKRIAKGELVQLGETIGVKILKLGE